MMCTALTAKASTCIAYDECIEDVNLTHEKTVTESECTDRLAVEVVLAKTKCHLLHLSKVFNNENSTNDCDAVTVDDSSLVCTLQEVPAVSACSDDDDIASPTLPSPPGFDCTKWIAAEYSSFNVSYKQVDTCKIEEQCNLPTHVGTHKNIDGCIDSGNYCDFYGRHQDACSDYPDDNADIKCCACSGGSTRSCDAAFDCSGHGTTSDTDTTDGCICECADGYSGADCAIPPPAPICTSSGDWTPIVKYFEEGWVPTVEAHGDMTSEMTNDTAWAKLSDSDINSISNGSTWHFYKMGTESTFSTQKMFYIRTKMLYSDVSNFMGAFGKGAEICIDHEELEDCTWQKSTAKYKTFDTYPHTKDTCDRWMTTGLAGCKGNEGDGVTRCFTSGAHCSGNNYGRITGVTIYAQCWL